MEKQEFDYLEVFKNQLSMTNQQIKQIEQEFNTYIKDEIQLEAEMVKHKIKHRCVIVTMQININQFYQWMLENTNLNVHVRRNLRKHWYLFLNGSKDIFDYGYYFQNAEKIDKFLPKKNSIKKLLLEKGCNAEDLRKKDWLKPLDYYLSIFEEYNICSTAIITNFVINDDKNSFTFDIVVEGSLKSEDIDKDIKNYVVIDPDKNENESEEEDKEEKEDENESEKENDTEAETKEEEMKRLIKQYQDDGINHAHIAYEVLKQQQDALSDVDFIKQIGFSPKVVKHEQKENNIISVKQVITKRQFVYDFLRFREKDTDQVWIDFCNDFSINSDQYLLKAENVNLYLSSINLFCNEIVNKAYHIETNSIKITFWTDISTASS